MSFYKITLYTILKTFLMLYHFKSLADLVNFSKLEILDMSGNKCSGSISSYIRALPSLKALSLSNNEFKGTLPTQGEIQYISDACRCPYTIR